VLEFGPGALERIDMIGLQQLTDVFLDAPADTEFNVGGNDFLRPRR
jgi:hypothetical protein